MTSGHLSFKISLFWLCLHSIPQNIFLFNQRRVMVPHSGKDTRRENFFTYYFFFWNIKLMYNIVFISGL